MRKICWRFARQVPPVMQFHCKNSSWQFAAKLAATRYLRLIQHSAFIIQHSKWPCLGQFSTHGQLGMMRSREWATSPSREAKRCGIRLADVRSGRRLRALGLKGRGVVSPRPFFFAQFSPARKGNQFECYNRGNASHAHQNLRHHPRSGLGRSRSRSRRHRHGLLPLGPPMHFVGDGPRDSGNATAVCDAGGAVCELATG